MPPDQLEKKPDASKRHQRSRSFGMTPAIEVIDHTTSAKAENWSSKKHDLNDQNPQDEGPSKRPKLKRGSEPPMRKDTNTIPRIERKKLKKEIDHCKASRTSNHQKLKESVANLERELADSRQTHNDTKQQLEETEQELKESKALKRELKQTCKKSQQNLEEVEQAYKNTKHTLQETEQSLEEAKQELNDAVEELERQLNNARQELRDTKKELKNVEHELAYTKGDLASNLAKLENVQKISEAKADQIRKQQSDIETDRQRIQSLQALINDPTNGLYALQQSCKSKEEGLKAKDAAIAAQREELHSSNLQNAALKETLHEAGIALKNASSKYDDCQSQLRLSDEKLRSGERALEDEKLARESAEKEVNALHLVNAKHGYQTQRAVLRGEKAMSELKSERKEHKNSVSALREENTELQTHCAELQATIQRHNYKEPDEKIKKDFASLESKVRQFIDKFARPVVNATDEELYAVWPNWSPRLRDFLATPMLCSQVLEAYVWECLVDRVFTAGSQISSGEFGQILERALSMAGVEEIDGAGSKSGLYIDLQYLRSGSSRLISPLNGANWQPEHFASDVNTMNSTLATLMGRRERGLREMTDAMEGRAMKIFESARSLEIQLRMLKAIHTVQMHKPAPDGERLKYGFSATHEDMEDRSPGQSGNIPGQAPLVDFIMCPGLYKCGTNSGSNYGTTSCLIKMGVVCNATQWCREPSPSTPTRPGPNQDQTTLPERKVRQQNSCNSQDLTANSIESASGQPRPTRAAKGQGAGSARKKAKTTQGTEADAEYDPKKGI